ncbi:enoyl-CoA hydratase/isomerase domain protein [Mycobacterium xenopi 3993]|nr:enoyl-CoA hydratase/isomerase domain protein [Mycobacterium xenopi 3993]
MVQPMVDAQRPPAEEIIRYAKDAETKIATITFNRPEFLNAPPPRRACATPICYAAPPSTTTSKLW